MVAAVVAWLRCCLAVMLEEVALVLLWALEAWEAMMPPDAPPSVWRAGVRMGNAPNCLSHCVSSSSSPASHTNCIAKVE